MLKATTDLCGLAFHSDCNCSKFFQKEQPPDTETVLPRTGKWSEGHYVGSDCLCLCRHCNWCDFSYRIWPCLLIEYFKLALGIKFLALFLAMAASIILGMGLPTTACYIVTALTLAPALVNMGVPLAGRSLFCVLFCYYVNYHTSCSSLILCSGRTGPVRSFKNWRECV